MPTIALRTPSRLNAALATLALAGALAGCGGGSSDNGIASKSPTEILNAAKSAVAGASSVHVSGSASSNGTPLSLDLELVTGKGAKGTVSEHGLSFQLIELGGYIYINGSQAFYTHFGGSAAAALFKGKWLKAPANQAEFASLSSLTNLQTLLSSLLNQHGTISSTGTSTVAGHKVVGLHDSTAGGTLYIATDGTAYPVEVTKGGKESGTITFDRWNQSVSLSAPANAIDITQLQAQAGG
ncbi:MAG: hypothetical protein KGJ43_01025 [Acidobacteriota bacterium]|nr:hypothetical protein [Acidobacteriota bacterium]